MELAEWRADQVYSRLQIRPSAYYGRMCMAQRFVVTNHCDCARSTAKANPQFGAGGGERVYIPSNSHGNCLMPDELFVLNDTVITENAAPIGFISEVIAVEVASGNAIVMCDSTVGANGVQRYWLREYPHESEIRKGLGPHDSMEWYEDTDIYGSTCGFTDRGNGQVLIAPAKNEKTRTWLSRLWSSLRGQ
jgi:hypothetical protein